MFDIFQKFKVYFVTLGIFYFLLVKNCTLAPPLFKIHLFKVKGTLVLCVSLK